MHIEKVWMTLTALSLHPTRSKKGLNKLTLLTYLLYLCMFILGADLL